LAAFLKADRRLYQSGRIAQSTSNALAWWLDVVHVLRDKPLGSI
jgi:hypothetical protein